MIKSIFFSFFLVRVELQMWEGYIMFVFEILSRIFNSYGDVTDCNQCLVRFKFNSLSVASTRVYNDRGSTPPPPPLLDKLYKGGGSGKYNSISIPW